MDDSSDEEMNSEDSDLESTNDEGPVFQKVKHDKELLELDEREELKVHSCVSGNRL